MLLFELISFTTFATLATLSNATYIPRSKKSHINFEYEYIWSKEPGAIWRQDLKITNSNGKELQYHHFEKNRPGCTAEGQSFKVTSSCWSNEVVFRCATNQEGNIEWCEGNEGKGDTASEDAYIDLDVVAHHDTCAGSITLKDDERCNSWDTFTVEIKEDGSHIERQGSFIPMPYTSYTRETDRLQYAIS